MGFTEAEKIQLLSLKGVGPTVISRFEQIGIHSLEQLKDCTSEGIAEQVASMLRTTCWKNSPKAKSAIQAAIELAKETNS
jgi:predicted RecB family nuclease